MTSRPLESDVGPRRLSADEIAEDDFVRGIAPSTRHGALVISTPGGQLFYGFCLPCGSRLPLVSTKARAQRACDQHNEENADATAAG